MVLLGIFDDASKAKEFTDWTIFSTNPEVGIHQVPPLV
jgi:hypothetical protein